MTIADVILFFLLAFALCYSLSQISDNVKLKNYLRCAASYVPVSVLTILFFFEEIGYSGRYPSVIALSFVFNVSQMYHHRRKIMKKANLGNKSSS